MHYKISLVKYGNAFRTVNSMVHKDAYNIITIS